MKKIILLFGIIFVSCSKDEKTNENCICQDITFKQTINLEQGIYIDYTTKSCLAWWEENTTNLTFDITTSPITIYGPGEKKVTLINSANNLCQ